MTEYKDCLACRLKYCPPECFDRHEGSEIALGKLMNEISDKKGVKVHLVRER